MKNLKNLDKLQAQARKAIRNGDFLSAIKTLNTLLEKNSSHTTYLMMRGEALLRAEIYDDALQDYAKVVEQEPRNVDALSNFAVALIRCNRQLEAQKILEYVLEIDPNNFDAHINLGNVYQTLRQPELNLKNAFKAVELNPQSAIAFNNLGTALGDLQMTEESRQAFLTSTALTPDYIPALINLAQVEEKLENRTEAMVLYEKLLTLKALTAGQIDLVKYYLAYSYLYFGRLKEGWRNYEFGFGAMLPSEASRSLRRFHQPKWMGEDIKGKRLLLWGEQGLGDEIMFSTCFHEVLDLGASVVLECEPRLVSIFQRAYPSFEVRAPLVGADRYSSANDFDIQCPFGSLFHLFRDSLENFQRFKPAFIPQSTDLDFFQSRLQGKKDKILVGICWRSGLLSAARNLNYTALIDWRELLSNEKFQFVNLQYGDCEAELLAVEQELGISVLRWPDVDLKNDLEKVLALIHSLDCIVSAPTAVAQMSGALGQKTYLLTRRNWTMLGEVDHYPWYPKVTPLVAEKGIHLAENIHKLLSLMNTDSR